MEMLLVLGRACHDSPVPHRSQGCLEQGCELCTQNPSRRCADNFSGKYLSGDALGARCGAPIRLEVIDRMTGEAVNDDALANIQVEVRARRRGSATAVPAEVLVAAADFDSNTAATHHCSLSLQYLICWSASMAGRSCCDLLPCLLVEVPVNKAVE